MHRTAGGKLLVSAASILTACLALLAPTSAATAAPATADAPAGVLSVWQYNYHYNWFTSLATCDAYGYSLKYYEEVEGLLNWQCERHPGHAKWSIHLLWET